MAATKLADVINTEVYKDLPAVNSPEKTEFYVSGVVTRSGQMDVFANSPSATGELPFWTDIDASVEPNLSSDADNKATPNKVIQGKQSYRIAYLNNGWSAKDLVSELGMGVNALQHVKNRVDAYWTKQWQKRLISASLGILADNVANDNGDMVFDAYVDAAVPAAVTKFSLKNFNNALIGTMGDAFEKLGVIVMHSAVYQTLADNNGAEDVRDSEGTLLYKSYKGHRVVIDDSMPVAAGTNSDQYTSIIFGANAFAYGVGSPAVPVAVEREESEGDGGGQETLWTRETWLLHPAGFQDVGTPAGQSYSNAELAVATSWDRVIERKNVNLAFLQTNI